MKNSSIRHVTFKTSTLSLPLALALALPLGLTILNFGSTAHAQSKSYDMTMARGLLHHWLKPAADKLSRLKTQCANCNTTPQHERAVCASTYQPVVDKRRIEVRVAFGYFDISDGKDYHYNGTNWGKSMSQDIFYEAAFRDLLKSSCKGGLEACDFREDRRDPSLLTKTVRGPSGEQIEVAVRTASSSVTPFYTENLMRAGEQKQRTATAEELFFGSIKSADVVLYVGHSRSGGGADFNPPRLMNDGKPQYRTYYIPKKPGLNRIEKELLKPGRNPMLFGHLSCTSEKYFGSRLRAATAKNPSGLLLTDAKGETEDEILSQTDDLLKSAFATVDSVMRFQCASGFREALEVIASRESKTVFRNFLGAPPKGK